ncbi:hypothetical protein [Klebsiella pneumoniae]|uniref:hypothetical protein n=1 Tax=Klebsiella pneumoniae TaxID=573 RepID=UPI0037C0E3EB|nr:hypothetical protein [Klebsiella pneumoniae]
MSEEKFNPQDIEEILSRPPYSDSHKVKKGDIPEIAKSIGIGAIEIVKALPILAFGALSISTKHTPITKAGYRDGSEGYGYYDETGLRNRTFDPSQSDDK